MATTSKLTVWAPATPGADAAVVAECGTIAEARNAAKPYERRADLRRQDVYIRLGRDGKIIERCGPCR